MQCEGIYRRPAFLNDHPVVAETKLFAADEALTAYQAGSVLGVDASGKLGLWTEASASVAGILAEDIVCVADADVPATVYVHASVKVAGLVWADSVTTDVITATAVPALRAAGIFAE